MGCHGRWQASRSLPLRRVRAQAPENTVSFRVTPERKLTSGYGTLLDLDTAAAAECSHDNATTYPKDATIHSNSPMGSDIGTTGWWRKRTVRSLGYAPGTVLINP